MNIIIFFSSLLAISLVGLVATQSDSSTAWVHTDVDLYNALCEQKTLIWLGADLDLREEHWPKNCTAPVRYAQNLTISGPLNKGMQYQVSFNFVARKVVIPPNGEVRLRHFTARNTRRGGGGEIDFIAYSPNGILWTDDFNKNQIICAHADLQSIRMLPLPARQPEFANMTQIVSNWSSYCTYGTYGRCWQGEVLHYDAFFTDVNVGSDTVTGGYVMAKRNSSKTCDEFATSECLKKDGELCLMRVINAFLAALPPVDSSSGADDSSVNVLAIALPVALGGAALIAGITLLVFYVRRRRRRDAAVAAQAAAAAAKLADLETGGAAGAAEAGGTRAGGAAGPRGELGTLAEGISSGSSGSKAGVSAEGLPDHVHGTSESFKYETKDDMGRCLSKGGAGGPFAASPKESKGGLLSGGGAIIEEVMDDGSTCVFSVGAQLGQGSYGVVFKGTWQEKTVAVKLILCDKACSEQVATEVRLMMSEACRHPSLLRAFTCMTRTKVISKQTQAGQAVQSAIASLASTARSRSGPSRPPSVRSVNSDATELVETWIVSEYCDLGSLAPLVHIGKMFMLPAAADPYDSSSCAVIGTAAGSVVGAPAGGGFALCPPGSGAPASAPALAPATGVAAAAAVATPQPLSTPSPSGPERPTLPHDDMPSPLQPPQLPLQPPVAQPPQTDAFQLPLQPQSSLVSLPSASGPSRGLGRPGAGALMRPNMAAILGCLRDIAAGMAHLHSLNIVHGDLKLANVLLATQGRPAEGTIDSGKPAPSSGPPTPAAADATRLHSSSLAQLPADFVAKVADFGLSRWLKEGQTHHSTRTVGTVTHMPPELLRSGKLTLSGDVYSFGIIMWELLTGSVPYKGLMYGEVVERVVVSQRRPEFPALTPAAYRSLAERCWSGDAAARPTFAAVLSELEALLLDAPALQAESSATAIVLIPSRQGSALHSISAAVRSGDTATGMSPLPEPAVGGVTAVVGGGDGACESMATSPGSGDDAAVAGGDRKR